MNQTTHFFNLGYGWLCKHCSAEDSERNRSQPDHGERRAAQLPLAKWVEEEERFGMMCTRCGIFEQARKPN